MTAPDDRDMDAMLAALLAPPERPGDRDFAARVERAIDAQAAYARARGRFWRSFAFEALAVGALLAALWLLSTWLEESGEEREAAEWTARARQAAASFNARFWNDRTGYLFDVVDGEHGDDPACRPNQIFALSLDHPALSPDRWRPVFDAVTRELLTPLGLRSLAPDHPDFRPTYHGDLRTRDAACSTLASFVVEDGRPGALKAG